LQVGRAPGRTSSPRIYGPRVRPIDEPLTEDLEPPNVAGIHEPNVTILGHGWIMDRNPVGDRIAP
jgi:hypothetical protein